MLNINHHYVFIIGGFFQYIFLKTHRYPFILRRDKDTEKGESPGVEKTKIGLTPGLHYPQFSGLIID